MSNYKGNTVVELRKPQRSQFDLSHFKRLTARMGKLIPCFVAEAVPSDVFRGSSEVLVRLAPLLAPIYDLIELYVHFFFVPNRILWVDWEKMITGGRLGTGVDPVDAPIPPYIDLGSWLDTWPDLFAKSSLSDYLGVPIFDSFGFSAASYSGKHMDALPYIAYQRCFYDYYRDRNFVADDFLTFPVPSGEMDAGTEEDVRYFAMRNRNYRQDYFTAALPFTQRGEEVLMPLAGTGSVSYLDQSNFEWGAQPGSNPTAGAATFQGTTKHMLDQDDHAIRVENIDEVLFDGSSVSINDFRQAYALQVWLERNAVAGSRYTESIQAHFAVRPQDSRLQRAEYIGGGRIPVKISEIVSTAYSNDGVATVPLANLAGHGITYGNTNGFNYFCPEHGFIVGIMSIMSPASYHQGLPRMFRRRTFLDYPWPTFSKLGEQPVNNFELYANPASLTEDADGEFPIFGYQSRYADWKQIQSTNHGDFHDTLLFWTLTRNFSGPPVLGGTFNYFDQTTQDRLFAVNGENDNFWCYINNRCMVKRPLPYFGTPNTLGFS